MPFEKAILDLHKSGLEPEDLNIRKAGIPELAACGLSSDTEAYAIPYYSLNGRTVGFYRLKVFNKSALKYIQPKQSSNHVFYPRQLMQLLHSPEHLAHVSARNQKRYLLLVEGEKKAAAGVKNGFPCLAFGGVDSWKNRTLILPAETDFVKTSHHGTNIAAKLPSGAEDLQETVMNDTILAHGFIDLIDYASSNKTHLIICYDSDRFGTKPEVQRAAASLGFELRYRGIGFKHIHQIVLPQVGGLEKVGLDDLLVTEGGSEILDALITNTFRKHFTFPKHPNPREYVNRKLQKQKMSRKECQQVAQTILCDMDANGTRLRSKEEQQMYYFDARTHRLMQVHFNLNQSSILHSTTFGQTLYQNYGVSSVDARVLQWLDAQFNGEEPIEEVTPNRVIGMQKPKSKAYQVPAASTTTTTSGPLRGEPSQHCVRYQINDGQYVKVSADPQNPIQIMDNGAEGYMFLSDQVEPINSESLLEALEYLRKKPMTPWWLDVLDDVRLKVSSDEDKQTKLALMLLYYVSPWLNKWQGMQLPVELITGEAGSGKSSLYEHRLNILSGNPALRNAPSDLKDWHASITNTGGLHVTDNVQLVNRDLRQRLSDELCRIVTEPNPRIEMRKLYSNNELIQIPIHATFAITAIQQPFQNADLIQRSMRIELDKAQAEGEIEYDSEWVNTQMSRFGGRVNWIAHHLLVLERFFALARQQWDNKYMSRHRLIHFEQSLRVMARVFDLEDDWIPQFLAGTTEKNIAKADWVIEGLVAFGEHQMMTLGDGPFYKWRFSTAEIVAWAEGSEEFKDNHVLNNTRSLGRYMQSNRHLLRTVAKIDAAVVRRNKQFYRFLPPSPSSGQSEKSLCTSQNTP